MTPEDLARLREEERALIRLCPHGNPAWACKDADMVKTIGLLLTRLALARRVVEAASRWDHWGKVKAIHVLTCKECERLEAAEDRWCEEASKIARTQLDAAKALQAALVAHDGEVAHERG